MVWIPREASLENDDGAHDNGTLGHWMPPSMHAVMEYTASLPTPPAALDCTLVTSLHTRASSQKASFGSLGSPPPPTSYSGRASSNYLAAGFKHPARVKSAAPNGGTDSTHFPLTVWDSLPLPTFPPADTGAKLGRGGNNSAAFHTTGASCPCWLPSALASGSKTSQSAGQEKLVKRHQGTRQLPASPSLWTRYRHHRTFAPVHRIFGFLSTHAQSSTRKERKWKTTIRLLAAAGEHAIRRRIQPFFPKPICCTDTYPPPLPQQLPTSNLEVENAQV
ncbi:hypothetical protein K456DRAFT_31411 [Colletotrichum gloeosporioides 23]|nr:hypothetical protein K456DRAFT_31411 [Colletotrichum gloeosporioides 23]